MVSQWRLAIVFASTLVGALALTPRPSHGAGEDDASPPPCFDLGVADGEIALDMVTTDLVPTTQHESSSSVEQKLKRLEQLEASVAKENTIRLQLVERQAADRRKTLKRKRTSAIVTTTLGVAFQIAGAFELGVGLSWGPSPINSLLGPGTPGFIDTYVGMPLSIIGIVMWPVGTSQLVRTTRELKESAGATP